MASFPSFNTYVPWKVQRCLHTLSRAPCPTLSSRKSSIHGSSSPTLPRPILLRLSWNTKHSQDVTALAGRLFHGRRGGREPVSMRTRKAGDLYTPPPSEFFGTWTALEIALLSHSPRSAGEGSSIASIRVLEGKSAPSPMRRSEDTSLTGHGRGLADQEGLIGRILRRSDGRSGHRLSPGFASAGLGASLRTSFSLLISFEKPWEIHAEAKLREWDSIDEHIFTRIAARSWGITRRLCMVKGGSFRRG